MFKGKWRRQTKTPRIFHAEDLQMLLDFVIDNSHFEINGHLSGTRSSHGIAGRSPSLQPRRAILRRLLQSSATFSHLNSNDRQFSWRHSMTPKCSDTCVTPCQERHNYRNIHHRLKEFAVPMTYCLPTLRGPPDCVCGSL